MSNDMQAPARGREGFTLIEVIISVVLLGSILVMLGGLSFQAARTALRVNNSTHRQAYALEAVNRLVSMNYEDLTADSGGCDTITENSLSFGRCYTVTVSGKRADVTVTIKPLQIGTDSQTFAFSRVADPAPNPLNTK